AKVLRIALGLLADGRDRDVVAVLVLHTGFVVPEVIAGDGVRHGRRAFRRVAQLERPSDVARDDEVIDVHSKISLMLGCELSKGALSLCGRPDSKIPSPSFLGCRAWGGLVAC